MPSRTPTDQVVHLRLPKDVHRAARVAAAEDASTLSKIIADAVRLWLQRRAEEKAA